MRPVRASNRTIAAPTISAAAAVAQSPTTCTRRSRGSINSSILAASILAISTGSVMRELFSPYVVDWNTPASA